MQCCKYTGWKLNVNTGHCNRVGKKKFKDIKKKHKDIKNYLFFKFLKNTINMKTCTVSTIYSFVCHNVN